MSTTEASRVLKISNGCIHKVLKGQRAHTRKLVFMYYEEYLKQLKNNLK
jgi:hypothetical protein